MEVWSSFQHCSPAPLPLTLNLLLVGGTVGKLDEVSGQNCG